MARKKDTPKPISHLRFDFVDSLENVCQQSIMLLQAVDTVIKHGELNDEIKGILSERSKALRESLIGDGSDAD